MELTTSTTSTTSAFSGKKVKLSLEKNPNESIEVPIEVINMSGTIKNMLDDLGNESNVPIPIANVRPEIFTKIVEYCVYHIEHPIVDKYDSKKEDIVPFDAKFLEVDQSMLFEIILAANFLDIKSLLDTSCKTVANMIKGKSPEEIRKTFNIKNDFTPEEEEAVRKENEWCEDK